MAENYSRTNRKINNNEPLTGIWQKSGFSA
jgi:hypothetical protein